MKVKINITIDEDLIDYVDKYCKEHRTTRSHAINEMILHYQDYFCRLKDGFVWMDPGENS